MLLLLLLLPAQLSTALPAPVITWASHPVRPDQTVLLQVSPFANGSRIVLQANHSDDYRDYSQVSSQTTAVTVTVDPLFVSDAGVAVVVPQSFPPHTVYTASVENSTAPPIRINAPDLFWIQGSGGDSTTPGGWIRVFGRSLSFVPIGQLGLDTPPKGWMTSLRLSPTTAADGVAGQKPMIVTADLNNLSSFSALFHVPTNIPTGEYAVAVSNGPSGYVELDCFVHPAQPHLRSITIAEPRAAPTVFKWPAQHQHGVNESSTLLIDSSAHLRHALAEAGKGPAGPKVLQLERGWYAVAGAFMVPHDVTIRGAGEGNTLLAWQYQDLNHSVPALLSAADHTTPHQRWGVDDLSITANTYFHAVVNVTANTNGFRMRRVNIRANSFFCASTTGVENVTHAHQVAWSENSPNGAGRFSHIDPNVVVMNGRNWEISDSDIYSSWGVLKQPHVHTYDPKEMGGYGLLARNKLWNGKGPTVDCDGAKQWIVEENQITGVSPMSGGNSVATGESAFMHHLYWGKNRFQFDWGQDREIMTFDGGGIGYGGAIASVDGTGTVIKTKRLCHPTHIFTGGCVLILNGTGAGQVRRLIAWSADEDGSGCTFTIDAPFTTKLDPASGQWISAQIFKGASIWEGNQYVDVGSFQFYGMAIDAVVHAEVGQRMTGFHSWGQWHRRNDTGDRRWHNQPHPNHHVQFLGVEMLDGNGSPHAGVPMIPASNFKEGVQFNAAPFTVQGQQRGEDGLIFPIPMNRFVIFRHTHINGGNIGFDLGQGYWLSDAVCESNVMVGLAQSNQTVSNAGVASGPIAHGGGMKIVVRNNTVLW
jgi:hypothetical protein